MTKSELRKIFLARREALTVRQVADTSWRIADEFFDAFDLITIKTLQSFIPIAKFREIDTSLIYKKIWTDCRIIRTLAPRIDFESGEMESFTFNGETELVENKWGIREPAGGETVEPNKIDMVLVPLLCFDERGYRVGYGKGFYDRFLSRCRADCVKIGLSYFPPVADIDDTSEHDVKLDHCVTPERVFGFGTKKDAAEL